MAMTAVEDRLEGLQEVEHLLAPLVACLMDWVPWAAGLETYAGDAGQGHGDGSGGELLRQAHG